VLTTTTTAPAICRAPVTARHRTVDVRSHSDPNAGIVAASSTAEAAWRPGTRSVRCCSRVGRTRARPHKSDPPDHHTRHPWDLREGRCPVGPHAVHEQSATDLHRDSCHERKGSTEPTAHEQEQRQTQRQQAAGPEQAVGRECLQTELSEKHAVDGEGNDTEVAVVRLQPVSERGRANGDVPVVEGERLAAGRVPVAPPSLRLARKRVPSPPSQRS
jgi:hypothetical protein